MLHRLFLHLKEGYLRDSRYLGLPLRFEGDTAQVKWPDGAGPG